MHTRCIVHDLIPDPLVLAFRATLPHLVFLRIVSADLHTPLYLLHTAYCILHTAYSIQHTAYRIRHTAYGIRHTVYDIRHTAYGIRHTTYGIRHTTYGIRHIRHKAYGLALINISEHKRKGENTNDSGRVKKKKNKKNETSDNLDSEQER